MEWIFWVSVAGAVVGVAWAGAFAVWALSKYDK